MQIHFYINLGYDLAHVKMLINENINQFFISWNKIYEIKYNLFYIAYWLRFIFFNKKFIIYWKYWILNVFFLDLVIFCWLFIDRKIVIKKWTKLFTGMMNAIYFMVQYLFLVFLFKLHFIKFKVFFFVSENIELVK